MNLNIIIYLFNSLTKLKLDEYVHSWEKANFQKNTDILNKLKLTKVQESVNSRTLELLSILVKHILIKKKLNFLNFFVIKNI